MEHTIAQYTTNCPIINTNTDEQELALFEDCWNKYKTKTGINKANLIRMKLKTAC